jgi:eukaryotic-like serine/threonine-protein kinase
LRADVQWLFDRETSPTAWSSSGPEATSQPAAPPLRTGQRVGVYEIRGLLGAGGMGEVHRAYDTRLGRDVAIKVLPPGFTEDPERIARFEREARVLASLNHPNIAAIYGSEDSVTPSRRRLRTLVLELVDGETLAERIGRGPLPIPDATKIAIQIADALDACRSVRQRNRARC